MKTIIAAALLSVVCMGAQASNCKRLGHEEGKIHVIEAVPMNYTHIILPESVIENTKAIVGNKKLWDADVAGPHIYVKPNSHEPEARSTSLSVIGESGESYDFIVQRHSHLDTPCYKVAQGTVFSNSDRTALQKTSKAAPSNSANLWQAKYLEQQKALKAEKQQAVLDALRRYRYQIYTRYDWGSGGHSFIGKDFISDVYDDGRFTYIRVNKQNRGLMMIEAELDGQIEMIEAKYDTLNKMYTVSGIFPQFTMKYGKAKVDIRRDDNETAGEY